MNLSFSKRPLLLLSALLAVGACDCEDNPSRIEIIAPVAGQTLTIDDDQDPATPGLQFCVRVRAAFLGEAREDGLLLYLQAGRLEEDPTAPPDARMDITDAANQEVCFDTTFAPGNYRLLACVDDCEIRSSEVPITVEDPCGAITFVAPNGSGDVNLGPSDNSSMPGSCGTFTTPVRVSTRAADGTEAQLFVNATPAGTATVNGGVLDFGDVTLGNRGGDANTLRIVLETGFSCEATGPRIFVDCDGVSCAITRPDTESAFLNQSDDTSMADGFQTTFELTMGDNAADTAQLRIDGEVFDAPTMIRGGQRVATFDNLALSEGPHVVDGICTDRLGEDTVTTATWIVDTTPCNISVSTPEEGDEFIDDDDADTEMEGIQTDISGSFSGEACTAVRVGICDTMLTAAEVDAGTFTVRTTLSGAPMQSVCAEVEDQAGNVAEARVGISVMTDAPVLDIAMPSGGAQYNQLGAMGFTADLDPATNACDADFVVNCTEAGAVDIVQMGTSMIFGSAPCEPTAGLPIPYTHQATLQVPLQSRDDGSTYNVVARMVTGRLTGFSTPVEVNADCTPPGLTVLRPGCGSLLRPGVDDQDPATPGLQIQTEIVNPVGSGVNEVTLSVTGNPDRTVSRHPTRSLVHVFPGVTYGAGDVTVRACATDPLGNVGCTDDVAGPCTIAVRDLPTVNIVQPAIDAILSGDDDCDSGTAGMQVRVRVSTDAADGATATIRFAAEPTAMAVVAGGAIDVCVDAPNGDGIPLVVTITDTRGSAMSTASVTIDSMPPTDGIDDLTFDITNSDRRGGFARLNFTAVGDADGTALSRYELRCASTPITSEAEWTAAQVFAATPAPAGPGSLESRDVDAFRPGITYQCTLRGEDITGAQTPIGNSAAILLDFLVQEVSLATARELGWYIVPVGSVDGDMFADFLVAGNSEVTLYFGGPSLSSAPTVRIVGPDSFGWTPNTALGGVGIAGIGDFNRDGRPDFAVAAPAADSMSGAVYVFFGKTTRDAWGTEIDTTGACNADICFGGVPFGAVGSTVDAAGDFDGDGTVDLMIGANVESTGGPAPTTREGVQYIIRGSNMYSTLSTPTIALNSAPAGGFKITTAVDRQALGTAAVSMGDLTADGRFDVVLGMGGVATVAGRVAFVPGRAYVGPGLNVIDVDAERELGSGFSGYALGVTNLGDVDGGSSPELGIFHVDALRGRMIIRAGERVGSPGMRFLTETVYSNGVPNEASDRFAYSMANGRHPVFGLLGDLDNDGLADILTGSYERGSMAGSVELFYGGPLMNRARATADRSFQPTAVSTPQPRRVNFVGDINGDGYDDFVIGDPQSSTLGTALLYY